MCKSKLRPNKGRTSTTILKSLSLENSPTNTRSLLHQRDSQFPALSLLETAIPTQATTTNPGSPIPTSTNRTTLRWPSFHILRLPPLIGGINSLSETHISTNLRTRGQLGTTKTRETGVLTNTGRRRRQPNIPLLSTRPISPPRRTRRRALTSRSSRSSRRSRSPGRGSKSSTRLIN